MTDLEGNSYFWAEGNIEIQGNETNLISLEISHKMPVYS